MERKLKKQDFMSVPFDIDCRMLSISDACMFLEAMREIAETAIRENFGKLDIRVVEIYNSLKDKNEALFTEWVNR